MYYIINETNHIIAADKALLELLSINTIGELHQNIALNSISLETTDDDTLNISTLVDSTSYPITSHTLTSVLGDMTLIVINEAGTVSDKSNLKTSTADELDFTLLDDEPITFNDTPAAPSQEIKEEKEEEKEEAPISILEDEEPFDLMADEEPFILEETEQAQDEEKPSEEADIISRIETETEETTPIVINVAEISQMIGISEEDYNAFLNEYIDTALTLEEDLKSTQSKKRSHAVSTLSHLSNVLHLPVISQIMKDIEGSDEDEQNQFIRSFFDTLARLTTSTQDTGGSQKTEEENIAEAPEPETSSEIPSSKSFGTIDLSDVKPIHFDFQLEEAANDLSLPVELIEEFVIDFIDQAHVETDNMLRAYENGDLETIQKIGHLLKGTSSNLRINPLADTLYKIQFCENSSQLEDLIKEYWAHFLSFEHQINIISK